MCSGFDLFARECTVVVSSSSNLQVWWTNVIEESEPLLLCLKWWSIGSSLFWIEIRVQAQKWTCSHQVMNSTGQAQPLPPYPHNKSSHIHPLLAFAKAETVHSPTLRGNKSVDCSSHGCKRAHFVGECGWAYPLSANICGYGSGWETSPQFSQHSALLICNQCLLCAYGNGWACTCSRSGLKLVFKNHQPWDNFIFTFLGTCKGFWDLFTLAQPNMQAWGWAQIICVWQIHEQGNSLLSTCALACFFLGLHSFGAERHILVVSRTNVLQGIVSFVLPVQSRSSCLGEPDLGSCSVKKSHSLVWSWAGSVSGLLVWCWRCVVRFGHFSPRWHTRYSLYR